VVNSEIQRWLPREEISAGYVSGYPGHTKLLKVCIKSLISCGIGEENFIASPVIGWAKPRVSA
jgi:hypothetical protein